MAMYSTVHLVRDYPEKGRRIRSTDDSYQKHKNHRNTSFPLSLTSFDNPFHHSLIPKAFLLAILIS